MIFAREEIAFINGFIDRETGRNGEQRKAVAGGASRVVS